MDAAILDRTKAADLSSEVRALRAELTILDEQLQHVMMKLMMHACGPWSPRPRLLPANIVTRPKRSLR